MLITSAPWSAAQTIPAASREPWCRMLSAVRIGMICASGAMPAMPSPLSAAAPSTPATFVPWLFCVSDVTERSFMKKSKPGVKRPFRSGWSVSTPTSMSAITTPFPVESAQARSTEIPRSLVRSHCSWRELGSGLASKSGSFGGSCGNAASAVAGTSAASASAGEDAPHSRARERQLGVVRRWSRRGSCRAGRRSSRRPSPRAAARAPSRSASGSRTGRRRPSARPRPGATTR